VQHPWFQLTRSFPVCADTGQPLPICHRITWYWWKQKWNCKKRNLGKNYTHSIPITEGAVSVSDWISDGMTAGRGCQSLIRCLLIFWVLLPFLHRLGLLRGYYILPGLSEHHTWHHSAFEIAQGEKDLSRHGWLSEITWILWNKYIENQKKEKFQHKLNNLAN
jgi:hypothetical protein